LIDCCLSGRGEFTGIHVFRAGSKDVDGRDTPGHDDGETLRRPLCSLTRGYPLAFSVKLIFDGAVF
jgi:hypothetical protein